MHNETMIITPCVVQWPSVFSQNAGRICSRRDCGVTVDKQPDWELKANTDKSRNCFCRGTIDDVQAHGELNKCAPNRCDQIRPKDEEGSYKQANAYCVQVAKIPKLVCARKPGCDEEEDYVGRDVETEQNCVVDGIFWVMASKGSIY